MWTIMKYTLYEKLKKKDVYIIGGLCVIIQLLICSGSTEITIDGEAVTSFSSMFPVLHTIVNATGCIFAAVISCSTIPKEYERHSSHLVWARRISQPAYHGGLALANMIMSGIPVLCQYVILVGYVVKNGQGDMAARMGYGFLIVMIAVAVVSFLTSAISIVLPAMPSGVIGVLFALLGIFHGVFELYQRMVEGIPARLLRIVLTVIPNLHKIGRQAVQWVLGEQVSIHLLLIGLLMVYLGTMFVAIFRKKEA